MFSLKAPLGRQKMIARPEYSNIPTNLQNKLYLIVRSIRLTKENYRTGRPSGDVVDLFPGYSLQQKLRPSVGQVFNYGLQTIVGGYLLQHWQNQCWGFFCYFKYLKWDTLQQPQASIPLFQLLYKHRTKTSVLHVQEFATQGINWRHFTVLLRPCWQ